VRNKLFRYLAPKLGCVEGFLLTRRAMALHWLLFPIESLSWQLSNYYGFCPMSNSINIGGKKIGIRELNRLLNGGKYSIQYKDGSVYVERLDE